MSKKSGTVDIFDDFPSPNDEEKQTTQSRKDVQAALVRLQKIAESLPPVDVVAIVREGRDASPNN